MSDQPDNQQTQFDFDKPPVAETSDSKDKVSFAFLQLLQEQKEQRSEAAILAEASAMARHLKSL